MKILTIKQPWADAIIFGGKDIENRTWNTKYRGRFIVHASAKVDMEAPEWVWAIVREFSPDVPMLGKIIGDVELVNVVTESKSKWFQGPFGFVLNNPNPLPLLDLKGRLGFYQCPPYLKQSLQTRGCWNGSD